MNISWTQISNLPNTREIETEKENKSGQFRIVHFTFCLGLCAQPHTHIYIESVVVFSLSDEEEANWDR